MPVIRSSRGLPTFEQVRRDAYRELGDVLDGLRSDWQPGAGPTREQREALNAARAHIAVAREKLNQAAAS